MHHLADRAATLMAVSDSRVRYTLAMKPQEIVIMGDKNPTRAAGKLDMLLVRSADQTGVAGGRDIDTTMS